MSYYSYLQPEDRNRLHLAWLQYVVGNQRTIAHIPSFDEFLRMPNNGVVVPTPPRGWGEW